VFDLLLQILDDGCLTDSHGQLVSFKHTIIIITSNIGSAHLMQSEMAFTRGRHNKQDLQTDAVERMRTSVMPALKDFFKPELLNRIDEIIPFHTLGVEQLYEIADLMIAKTQQRISARSIDLQVTDAARSLLVERGYDPVYGARPLRRTIQSMLDDMLAESILRGAFTASDTVVVDVEDGKLVTRVMALVGGDSLSMGESGEHAVAAEI
jgi:ATP-dependent Clp protease ATP-binding subunit ClpC